MGTKPEPWGDSRAVPSSPACPALPARPSLPAEQPAAALGSLPPQGEMLLIPSGINRFPFAEHLQLLDSKGGQSVALLHLLYPIPTPGVPATTQAGSPIAQAAGWLSRAPDRPHTQQPSTPRLSPVVGSEEEGAPCPPRKTVVLAAVCSRFPSNTGRVFAWCQGTHTPPRSWGRVRN